MAIKVVEGFDNFGPNGMGGEELQAAISRRYSCQVLDATTLEAGWGSGLALRLEGSSYVGIPINPFSTWLAVGFACKGSFRLDITGISSYGDPEDEVKLTAMTNAIGQVVVGTDSLLTILLTSSKALRASQWAYVEFWFCFNDNDPSSGTVTININGEAVGELLDITPGINAGTSVRFRTGIFDDLYIADGFPLLGPSIVETLRPTGDGATSDWVPSANAAHYTLVDSVPVDANNYLTGMATDDVDLFTYDPTILDSIAAVKLSSMVTNDGPGITHIAHQYVANSNSYDGMAFGLADQMEASDIFQLDPETSDIWTPANLATANFGVKRL
jgi:hypothetical protein